MSSNSSNTGISIWRRIGFVAGIVAWTFLGFMLAQAVALAIIAGLQWTGVPLDALNQNVFNTVANIVVYVFAVAIIIGVPAWLKKRGTTLDELGISKNSRWRDLGWLALGAVAYLLLTVLITSLAMYIFPSGDYAQEQEIGFGGLTQPWEYSLAFLSLVVVAPIAEEVIFRGYLFGKLRKYAAVWVSVVLSSALFAVAHLQFNVALDTFALGIVLALLRVKTGSIWMSIALHALKNGVAFYFLFVNPLVL